MENLTSNETLSLNNAAINYLKESRKWAKFLAILGFIGAGLMVLAGLFMGTIFSAFPFDEIPGFAGGMGGIMGLIYILAALLYFFPSMYLYNFAEKSKHAILNLNNDDLALALKNHKSCFKFMGVTTIVIIGLYVFFAFFALLATMMSF